jgi:hypothetical protein
MYGLIAILACFYYICYQLGRFIERRHIMGENRIEVGKEYNWHGQPAKVLSIRDIPNTINGKPAQYKEAIIETRFGEQREVPTYELSPR